MQRIIAIIALVIGGVFLWWGHNAAQAVNSQVKQIFTGAPTDRTTYFYIGGIALVVFGLLKLIFAKKK